MFNLDIGRNLVFWLEAVGSRLEIVTSLWQRHVYVVSSKYCNASATVSNAIAVLRVVVVPREVVLRTNHLACFPYLHNPSQAQQSTHPTTSTPGFVSRSFSAADKRALGYANLRHWTSHIRAFHI
jgi:hypothetical protein